MSGNKVTRRRFLRGLAAATGGTILAACAPQVVKETVIVEKAVEVEKLSTVLVEKAVEKKVVETVVVEKEVAVERKVVETVVVEKEVMVQAPQEPVELQFFCWSVGWGADYPHGLWEEEQADAYMAMHPEVTINTQALGWDFAAKNLVGVAAGNPPNIQLRASESSIIGALQGNCALEVEYEQELVDDLEPNWYNNLHFQGKLYFYPFYKLANALRLNVSVVEEADAMDLLPPSDAWGPWTYDDYLALMKAVVREKDDGTQVWGNHFTTSRSNPFYYWPEQVMMWNWGCDTVGYNEDGSYKCRLDEDAAIEWLQFWYDLYDVHHVIPNPAGLATPAGDYWNQRSLLTLMGGGIGQSRQPGMELDNDTFIVTDTTNDLKFILPQPPRGPYATQNACWGGPMMDVNVMPYRTRDRDAIQPSIDFCEWLIDSEHQDFVATRHFPARESAAAKVDEPLVQWYMEHMLPYGRGRVSTQGGQNRAVCVELELAFQKVFTGMPVTTAAGEFCEVVNSLEHVEL